MSGRAPTDIVEPEAETSDPGPAAAPPAPVDGWNPGTATGFLRRLFCYPTSPVATAVLRIAVFGTIAYTAFYSQADRYAELPNEMLRRPALLGSTLARLPHTPGVVSAATWILIVVCLVAAVGFWSRTSAWIAGLLSIYVLGIPELYGKVNHYHHLVLVALVVAASPCGDALAIDAIGKSRPQKSARYGFPIRVTWFLIGLAYFFPGLSKLINYQHWLTSANMRGLIDFQQWAAGNNFFVPARLLRPAAFATLAFELGFIFLVFNRRTRLFAAAAGLAFHLSILIVLDINFWMLAILYVTFIDWGGRDPRFDERAPPVTARVVATAAIGGMLITGSVFLVNAWPVSSYPTFAGDYRLASIGVTAEVVAFTNGRPQHIKLFPWMPASTLPSATLVAASEPKAIAKLAREQAPHADRVQVWSIAESTRRANRGAVVTRKKVLDASLKSLLHSSG